MRSFDGLRIVGLLLLLFGVAALGYNAGLHQAGDVATGVGAAPHMFSGGAHMIGFGFFGFLIFGFLLPILFLGFLVRLVAGFLFWGGRHHGPRGPRGGWHGPEGRWGPPSF